MNLGTSVATVVQEREKAKKTLAWTANKDTCMITTHSILFTQGTVYRSGEELDTNDRLGLFFFFFCTQFLFL